jgi:hypothetical protein
MANEELKAIKCSKCGGGLSKSYRSEYDDEEEENVTIPLAKCSSCGAEFDQHTDEYYQLFADELTTDKDDGVFKLGAKGKLGGVEYEIIGRIRYQDEEEYEKSTWDEWFAVSAEGSFRYFVEEDGEIYSYEEYVPESIDLESDPSNIIFEGRKYTREEEFIGRIVYAEGELSWQPEIGEPVAMYDLKKDGAHYTIEKSEDEVSITRGEKLKYNKVLEAFGGKEHKDKYSDQLAKKKNYIKRTIVYSAAMAVSFGLVIFSCSKTKDIAGVMNGKMILSMNQIQDDGTEKAYVSQVVFGPFLMNEGKKLHTATVFLDEKIQPLKLDWQAFRFFLLPEDRLLNAVNRNMSQAAIKELIDDIDAVSEPVECYSLSGDFWDEEGYDDEGHWHENSLTADDDFILEKPGRYYAFIETYSQKPRDINAIGFAMQKSASYRYFIIAMFVFGGLLWFNIARHRSLK